MTNRWEYPDDESEFCECGVTLMDDPDETDGLCGVCARAPHGRECDCHRICEESKQAAEKANRRLVCTCGWTGPYIEHHRDRQADCVVSRREDAP